MRWAKPDACYLIHGLQPRCPPPRKTPWGQDSLRGKGCRLCLHAGLSWAGWDPCFSGARRLPWIQSLVLRPTPQCPRASCLRSLPGLRRSICKMSIRNPSLPNPGSQLQQPLTGPPRSETSGSPAGRSLSPVPKGSLQAPSGPASFLLTT